jgi:hypothetical protein
MLSSSSIWIFELLEQGARKTAEPATVRPDNEAIPDKHCRHFLRSLVFSRLAIYCDKPPTKRMAPHENASKHLASGLGRPTCIGNALARLQATDERPYIPRSFKRTDRC